jgi:hypothetical protein
MATILISSWVFQVSTSSFTAMPKTSSVLFTEAAAVSWQASTGDKLCYGSASASIVKYLIILVPNSSQIKLSTLDHLGYDFILLGI